MDHEKIGNIIRLLRQEKEMTQKQLADKMNLSDKTISKWERGLGCPDVSVLAELSGLLGVNIEKILDGDLSSNAFVGGNLQKIKYYVCPVCDNISLCTGNAEISCCGRRLKESKPQKAAGNQKLNVEKAEGDWLVSGNHPMNKEDYISFVALATSGRLQIIKQFPEWELQVYIPKCDHGMLIWYSIKDGLFYQLI